MLEKSEIAKEVLKSNSKILEMIYRDLAQPGIKKVGLALETVLNLSNTILLPLKLLNETSHTLFSKYMETYKEKLDGLSDENIIQVQPEIGIPILDRLTYTTNKDLGELFLNLLTSASNKDRVESVHPSFIEVIKHLCPDEAKILNSKITFLAIPFISIRLLFDPEESLDFGVDVKERLTLLDQELDYLFPENEKIYFDNLIGLGLVQAKNSKLLFTSAYDQLIEKHRSYIEKHKENYNPEKPDEIQRNEVSILHGCYELTAYGRLFVRACGLYDSKRKSINEQKATQTK